MLDFQINLSEKHIHEFLLMCRRAICILEFHLPTPTEDEVEKAMRPKDIKPGTVGRVDTDFKANQEDAMERYFDRTGDMPSVSEIDVEIEQMKEDGLI